MSKRNYTHMQVLLPEIEAMIAQRNEAKNNKDYAMADHLRNILQERGIVLLDTPQGTFWEKN